MAGTQSSFNDRTNIHIEGFHENDLLKTRGGTNEDLMNFMQATASEPETRYKRLQNLNALNM